MKCVILAGGLGSRISEESHLRPKPMVEIGGRPIIWHIMKIFAAHGISEFVVCLGYKGYPDQGILQQLLLHMSDVTIDIARNDVEVHQKGAEPWKVTLGGHRRKYADRRRLKRVARYLGKEEFCLTYGDGVADVTSARSLPFTARAR